MPFLTDFTLTWDFGLAVFLFFAAFFYGLTTGKKKLALFLASLYFSLVIVDAVPTIGNFTSEMSAGRKFFVDSGVFIGIAILLFFLLAGSTLGSALRIPKSEESSWWHLILLSFVTAGFLFSSILAFLPFSDYNKLSSMTNEIFRENNAHFWWALAGILVLVLLRRTKKQIA